MEQGIFLTEQGIVCAEQGIHARFSFSLNWSRKPPGLLAAGRFSTFLPRNPCLTRRPDHPHYDQIRRPARPKVGRGRRNAPYRLSDLTARPAGARGRDVTTAGLGAAGRSRGRCSPVTRRHGRRPSSPLWANALNRLRDRPAEGPLVCEDGNQNRDRR
jgi:hypothetical protein